ncbi:MAG TPA: hypothetical protein VJX48_05575 [Xanthobacteraceae bacterium]|nr:hypothetical protein [Xanthobacteraceae bacterium]
MATPQEAKPNTSTASPGDISDIGSKTPQVEASASVPPSIEAINGSPPPGEAPKLDAEEPLPALEMAAEAAKEPAGEPAAAGGRAAAAPPARRSRFALLAATVALAAVLGSIVGSLSASGVAHLWSVAGASSGVTEANALQAVKAELAELSALKANLDGAARSANGQFAKITDRLDRVERAGIEPATKIARIADTVDRLEKRGAAAPETTGSIANNQPAAPADTKLPDKVLQNWVVQNVRGGRAVVESRYGGVFFVSAGSVLPGLGRVETIKRQDGQWVVVTARGVITEH